MKKELSLLLTTAMLTTCIGTAVAAPVDDTDKTPVTNPPAVTDTTDGTTPTDVKTGTEAPAADKDAKTEAPAADKDAKTDTEAPAADKDAKTDTAAPAADKDAKTDETIPAAELTAAEKVIAVTVDGKALTMDQAPVIQDGRTLVPLRAIFEALGAQVEWDADTQTVSANKRLDYISLTIGKNELSKNGEATALDVPAQIIEGRTMVPARAISEALGAAVEWKADVRMVTIESAKTGDHVITDKYLTDEVKAADGSKVLCTISAAYPVLANPDGSKIITEINTATEKFATDFLTHAKDTMAELKVDPAVVSAPYEFDLRFDVTYDQKGMLSFCNQASEYTGGAHPNTIMTGKTFDTTLGKELAMTDVLKGTQDEINKQITDAFTAQIDKAPDTYLKDAKESLAKDIDKAGFYLNKDGVVVYFQLYTLQPYAAGFSTCTLPLADTAK